MILSKEQLEKRLSSKDNLARSVTEARVLGEERTAGGNSISNLVKEDSGGPVVSEDGMNAVSAPEIEYKRFGVNETGKGIGGRNLTPEQRVAIGTLAHLEGNAAAAEAFGVTEGTANKIRSANKRVIEHGIGRDTIDMDLRAKIQERLDNTKLSATDLAAERLLRSLGCITDDKLENCSVKDAAQVSSQLSSVIRNLNGSSARENRVPAAKIVLIQPKASKEESFDVIEIGINNKE